MSAELGDWIVDPSLAREATCGLAPGVAYYKTRLLKGGPLVGVRTEVREPRGDDGELEGDVEYIVEVNGEAVPFEQWHNQAMLGIRIDAAEHRFLLADLAFLKDRAGLHERKAVDLGAMAPVLPPGAKL